MDLGRAIGFIAGGAAEGYGKGIVETARQNWEKMLKDQAEQRADARQAQNQQFETSRDKQRQEWETVEKGKDRDQRTSEKLDDIKLRNREIDARIAEADASRKSTEQYRKDSLAEQRRYRLDNYNLRLREIEGKESQITSADMKKIENAEKSLLGEFPNDDDREKAAPKIVNALQASGDPKLAKYYAALHGITPPAPASSGADSADQGVDDMGIPKGAAPGLGGGRPAPAAAPPAATAPAPGAQPSSAPAKPSISPQDASAALQSARNAIAKGAPRDAVISRLRAAGIDPSGL